MIFICVIVILFISLSSVISYRRTPCDTQRLRRQGLILVLGLPSDCPRQCQAKSHSTDRWLRVGFWCQAATC